MPLTSRFLRILYPDYLKYESFKKKERKKEEETTTTTTNLLLDVPAVVVQQTDREELQSQQQVPQTDADPPIAVEGSGNKRRKPSASSYVWAPRTGCKRHQTSIVLLPLKKKRGVDLNTRHGARLLRWQHPNGIYRVVPDCDLYVRSKP
ncbi:uncharacterized protein V6R79_007352 [Siganus canaliculatus]